MATLISAPLFVVRWGAGRIIERMQYTTNDVIAFLKELPARERTCQECGSRQLAVKRTADPIMFTVVCAICGNDVGLLNAEELIGESGVD